MAALLRISKLTAEIEGKQILRGVNLDLEEGEIVVLMGPNGSGKSTLAHVLMGHPAYTIRSGAVQFRGKDLLGMKPEERAKEGLFLSFQYPQEIAGVTMGNFLRLAYNATHKEHLSIREFLVLIKKKMKLLNLSDNFLTRSVNEGFSGGEKKQCEVLQLAVLEPTCAILDETDSGLDIDALKKVAQAVNAIHQDHPSMSMLIITHYQRILEHIPAKRIAIMKDGIIVREGSMKLLQSIEAKGYNAM